MAHSSLQALSLFTELGLCGCGYAFRLREAFQASLRDSEKSCDHHARAPSNAVHCDVCDCKCFLFNYVALWSGTVYTGRVCAVLANRRCLV